MKKQDLKDFGRYNRVLAGDYEFNGIINGDTIKATLINNDYQIGWEVCIFKNGIEQNDEYYQWSTLKEAKHSVLAYILNNYVYNQ